jgi:hypothetical protein
MNFRPMLEKPYHILLSALLLVYGILIVITFRDYGITPDETGHVHYGRSVVHWYTTFFAERGIFTWTNT